MNKDPVIEPGIRGWLVVVTIILFGLPGNFMAHGFEFARKLEDPVVLQFTDSLNSSFDPRWRMLVFSETAGFLIVAFLSILTLWPLFFLRHRFFPHTFACMGVVVAALLSFRAILAFIIPTMADAYRAAIYLQTALWLPVAVAVSFYIVRSRRAHVTFRHRLLPYPVFPFFTRI